MKDWLVKKLLDEAYLMPILLIILVEVLFYQIFVK
jgi:hypothetical protein